MHGGKTPAGIASPHLKHGRYSQHLPAKLLDRYQQGLSDEELLDLRHEVALVDARIAELLGQIEKGDLGARWLELQAAFDNLRLATQKHDLGAGREAFEKIGGLINGGANDYLVWAQITAFLEQRRRLVDTERRQLGVMQQMITTAQAMVLITALADIVRKHVADSDVLSRIQTDLTRLLDQQSGAADRPILRVAK